MTEEARQPEQSEEDTLTPKLQHAVDVVGDLLKVHRAYGERGPKAVFVHTEQLTEEQLRHVVTAMVSYISTSNAAVVAMLTASNAGDDGEVLL